MRSIICILVTLFGVAPALAQGNDPNVAAIEKSIRMFETVKLTIWACFNPSDLVTIYETPKHKQVEENTKLVEASKCLMFEDMNLKVNAMVGMKRIMFAQQPYEMCLLRVIAPKDTSFKPGHKLTRRNLQSLVDLADGRPIYILWQIRTWALRDACMAISGA